MSLRNKPEDDNEANSAPASAAGTAPAEPIHALKVLFKPSNRGLLLDVFVFVVNLFLMRLLVGYFLDVAHAAGDGDELSGFVMFLFCLSLFVLPPAGAVLKRWHFHERVKNYDLTENALTGCLFNPIFYFCLTAVIFSTVNAFVLNYFFGNRDPGPTIFISSIFLGIGLMITHTWLVYRYFSPPRRPPRSEFLRSPASETLGDIFIFLNMLFFQIIWNLLSFSGIPHPGSVGEFFGRLFVLVFVALLIYFPPRIFYLAEDITKRRTWIMILIANAPVIYRFVIGTGAGTDW
jgi:hypothetical protein